MVADAPVPDLRSRSNRIVTLVVAIGGPLLAGGLIAGRMCVRSGQRQAAADLAAIGSGANLRAPTGPSDAPIQRALAQPAYAWRQLDPVARIGSIDPLFQPLRVVSPTTLIAAATDGSPIIASIGEDAATVAQDLAALGGPPGEADAGIRRHYQADGTTGWSRVVGCPDGRALGVFLVWRPQPISDDDARRSLERFACKPRGY